MRNKIGLLIPVLVIGTSFWFWRLAQEFFLLALGLFILGVVLFSNYQKPRGVKFKVILILFLFISVIGLRESFYRGIFSQTGLEKYSLVGRHEIYATGLGRLYANRVGIFVNDKLSLPTGKFTANLFTNLDPNVYFFAGHPRERENGLEFNKFSFLWLPLFLVGVFFVFQKSPFLRLYSLITFLVSAFSDPGSSLGPFMFLPLIAVCISIGIAEMLKKI